MECFFSRYPFLFAFEYEYWQAEITKTRPMSYSDPLTTLGRKSFRNIEGKEERASGKGM